MFSAAYLAVAKRPAPQHPTQKQNAPAALAERGGANFEAAEDERCIAYRRLALKSLDVVSNTKNTGDDHDRQPTPQG
jgi:hypothetical protein